MLGGDGRYHNREAIQTILKMAAANGYGRVVVGQGGILSTPAASHLIRLRERERRDHPSASHNPGGPNGDFGVKYNIANGGPAPEDITNAVFRRSGELRGIPDRRRSDVDLDRLGETRIGAMVVEVVDPVADYADLMEKLFDFDRMRAWLKQGNRIRFDAMSAVTGPYAKEILERRLGAPAGTVINGGAASRFRRTSSRPEPRSRRCAGRGDVRRGRARVRRRLRRRRRPQHDHGPAILRHAERQRRAPCRQRASRARLSRAG